MTSNNYLDGKLLIAMPGMGDPRFERAVVYLCSHSADGAMGLVINHPLPSLSLEELLEQLDVKFDSSITKDAVINSGGPVEPGRGFVLHSTDYIQESTTIVREHLGVTATLDILQAIANGDGPDKHLMVLGYAGWEAGQLDEEIQNNAWLTADADSELIFHTEAEQAWPRAMAMLGVNISMLSSDAGHA